MQDSCILRTVRPSALRTCASAPWARSQRITASVSAACSGVSPSSSLASTGPVDVRQRRPVAQPESRAWAAWAARELRTQTHTSACKQELEHGHVAVAGGRMARSVPIFVRRIRADAGVEVGAHRLHFAICGGDPQVLWRRSAAASAAHEEGVAVKVGQTGARHCRGRVASGRRVPATTAPPLRGPGQRYRSLPATCPGTAQDCLQPLAGASGWDGTLGPGVTGAAPRHAGPADVRGILSARGNPMLAAEVGWAQALIQ